MTRSLRLPVVTALVLGLACLAVPTPVAAGEFAAGLRAGVFEPTNAQDSYDAVYGGTMSQIGVQLEYHTRGRLFFEATYDRGSVNGETVAVVPGGGPPIPTGIDTELKLAPLHVTIAWLFRPRSSAWNVYAGAGPSVLYWSETSALGDRSTSDSGASAVVGVRRNLAKWAFGGELRYSSFPNALGDSGVAGVFHEDDLGGFGLHALALYRF